MLASLILSRWAIRGSARLLVLLLTSYTCLLTNAAQVSVGIQNDLSKPTYGMLSPSTSSVTYDEKNGLNVKGAISDILGPPIRIANGFGNMIEGSKLAGVGTSLKSGGALLGIDAKLLEAAGGANLLKGGLLLGGAAAKTGAATVLGGLPGKKISSIIEMPVKVIAMKDLATGKALAGLGKVKGTEAVLAKTKGAAMIKEGDALKAQGLNQVIQGATEGLQNFGNIVQQTAGNAATAIKVMPLVFDLPIGQEQQHIEQQTEKTSQQQYESTPHQLSGAPASYTGGSLFGGLSSLLPGLSGGDPLLSAITGGTSGTQNKSPFNLFGSQNHNGYAAVLNSNNPLTNLLMNQNANPFLYPIMGGPLAQSLLGKQSSSTGQALISNGSSSTFNLLPGLKVSETTSSHAPGQHHDTKGQVVEQGQLQQ